MGNFEDNYENEVILYQNALKTLGWIDLLVKYRDETNKGKKLLAIKCLREIISRIVKVQAATTTGPLTLTVSTYLKETKELQDQIEYMIENNHSVKMLEEEISVLKEDYYDKYHEVKERMNDLSIAYRMCIEQNEEFPSKQLKKAIKAIRKEMLSISAEYFDF